jgi:hypothetical protein
MLTVVTETAKRGSPKCWIACHGLPCMWNQAIDMLPNLFSSTSLVLSAQKYAYCKEGTPSILRRSSVMLRVVLLLLFHN